MTKQNHYQVLQITDKASADDVKKAYRRLAHQYHPDHNPGNKIAEEKFKQIADAYAVLGDQAKRAGYDQELKKAAAQQKAAEGQGFYRTHAQQSAKMSQTFNRAAGKIVKVSDMDAALRDWCKRVFHESPSPNYFRENFIYFAGKPIAADAALEISKWAQQKNANPDGKGGVWRAGNDTFMSEENYRTLFNHMQHQFNGDGLFPSRILIFEQALDSCRDYRPDIMKPKGGR